MEKWQKRLVYLLAALTALFLLLHTGIGADAEEWEEDPVLTERTDEAGLKVISVKVSLRYDANGGSGEMPEVNSDGVIDINLPENRFLAPADQEALYYIFAGWNTQPDGKGESYQPGDNAEFREDTTLYAQWDKRNSLEEGFEGGWLPEGWTAESVSPGCQWTNGREDEDSEAGAHGGSGYASIYEIENDGDWSMLITPSLNLNISGQRAVLKFWYLNRRWDPKADEFCVFYRVDTGAWKKLFSSSEQHDAWTMDMVCLPEEACRKGVRIGFRGGLGAGLDDVALIISDPVTLSYDANDGSGDMQDQPGNADAGFFIRDNGFDAPEDPDAVFCVFTGWNTKADGSGTAYQPGSFAEFAEPTILYAQWESRDSFEEDFDDGKADGWTFADADGDGNGWSPAEVSKAHSGTGVLTSVSYDLDGLHKPDNWAFTPLLHVPENAQMSFWIVGRDNEEDYAEEKMGFYAGESPDPEKMVQIGEDYISQAGCQQYTVDLTEYAGNRYFAFRHQPNAYGRSALYLDDVALTVKPKEDPEVVSHSLLLSGEIGVNFYVRLPGRISDYENSYMLFTVGGEEKEPVYLNENFKNSSGTAYGFACYVNSLQMAEKITAAFCFGEDGSERIVDEYSVLDYVNYIIEHPDDYQEVLALARSISDYGYYAQQYLSGIHGFSLVKGEGYAPVPGSYITYTGTDFTEAAQKLQKYACSFENPSDGAERPFSSMTYSLAFDAQTEIRIYFRLKEEAETACSIRNAYGGAWENGGMSLRSDGRYMISIKNIPAHKLGEMFQVTISVGETEYRLTVSALSYASTVLGNAGLSDSEKAAMCALFHYYNCAVEYKQT